MKFSKTRELVTDFPSEVFGTLLHYDYGNYSVWHLYDENGNIINSRNGMGTQFWFTYDENNRCTSWRDSSGYEEMREYDENNNCVWLIQDGKRSFVPALLDRYPHLLYQMDPYWKVSAYIARFLPKLQADYDNKGNPIPRVSHIEFPYYYR